MTRWRRFAVWWRALPFWFDVWWHCLSKFFTLEILKEDHSMCKRSSQTGGHHGLNDDYQLRHFCSCGYLNDGVTYDEHKRRMGIPEFKKGE